MRSIFFEIFGAPKEGDWAAPNSHLRLSLPRVIMDMLNIPATCKARVITTMKAIIDAHKAKREYDPSAAIKSGRGAKALIEDYTPQAEVVYRVMESGMSLGNTVVVLNQWRRRGALEPISYGCLQRFVRSSPVMVLEKRETIKSGSKDEGDDVGVGAVPVRAAAEATTVPQRRSHRGRRSHVRGC